MTSPESPGMDRLREAADSLITPELCAAFFDEYHTAGVLLPADTSGWPRRAAQIRAGLVAVLAALLPVHRAMVLREATAGLPALPESLICDAIINPSVFLGYARGGESYPAWAARAVVVALQGFAASTPPGAPGSPQTAERVTPSETGGVEDTGVRELAVAPNVWVSFHGLDFAVAWHSVPGDLYRKVVKVIPHAKTPAAAVAELAEARREAQRLTAEVERLTGLVDDARAEVAETDVRFYRMADQRNRLAADVVQVMGERDGLLRLVASARTLLDQVARTEAVQNADEALAGRADDLARRIVDEIGPVAAALWDTPSTTASPTATTTAPEASPPWPGLPAPGLHLVTPEDASHCLRCGKFAGPWTCPAPVEPEETTDA